MFFKVSNFNTKAVSALSVGMQIQVKAFGVLSLVEGTNDMTLRIQSDKAINFTASLPNGDKVYAQHNAVSPLTNSNQNLSVYSVYGRISSISDGCIFISNPIVN